MNSIRKQLTRDLMSGTAILLVVFGVVLSVGLHARLLGEFDTTLEAKAEALGVLTSVENGRLEIDLAGERMPGFLAPDADVDEGPREYFEYRLADGSLILGSGSLGGGPLPAVGVGPEETGVWNVRLPDGRRGRACRVVYAPEVEDSRDPELDEAPDENEVIFPLPPGMAEADVRVSLTVMRGRDALDALLLSTYGMLAVLLVLLLVAIQFVAKGSIRRGFRPVDRLNAQLQAIRPGEAAGAISLPQPVDELDAIVQALNALLGRVEETLERERRFASNVAHELRTPVAELRSACDVGGKWPDDPAAVRDFFEDINDIAVQMEQTVTTLLELSRCDSKLSTVSQEAIDLDEMLHNCWDRVPAALRADRVTATFDIEPGSTIYTDRAKVQLILQNLLDNAASYSTPGHPVLICSHVADGDHVITIENTCAGVTHEDLRKFFDRFWRKEASRTGSQHSGLGLSLARVLADLLGIGLEVGLQGDTIVRAEVRVSSHAEI